MRKTFADVLREASIDIMGEYHSVFALYHDKIHGESPFFYSLRDRVSEEFMSIPFRGTCISLDDFEARYNWEFEELPSEMSVEKFLDLCEYVYNILDCFQSFSGSYATENARFVLAHIEQVIDLIGYAKAKDDGFTIFIERSSAVIAAAEITPAPISAMVLTYNHHSMKGDLQSKRSTLLQFADHLEPKRDLLKQIAPALEKNLFFLFNNINIRHNNVDPTYAKHYKKQVSLMNPSSLECWYDETYQLCLYAILMIDNIERIRKVEELRELLKEK